jgi:hypothetical protein
VDEVVITDGAGGFHYSTLSEPIYGVALTQQAVALKALPEIRRKRDSRGGTHSRHRQALLSGPERRWFHARPE